MLEASGGGGIPGGGGGGGKMLGGCGGCGGIAAIKGELGEEFGEWRRVGENGLSRRVNAFLEGGEVGDFKQLNWRKFIEMFGLVMNLELGFELVSSSLKI